LVLRLVLLYLVHSLVESVEVIHLVDVFAGKSDIAEV
jgi:hypothetical protein